MLKHANYSIFVATLYILSFVGIFLLINNEDYIWLAPMTFMVWIDHICISLHHRYISHKSFESKTELIHKLIILLSLFPMTHSPLRFAVIHRHHHWANLEDETLDAHGPATGFWNTLIFWEFNMTNVVKNLKYKMYKDLLRDKFLVWFDTHYYKLIIGLSLIVYLISWKLFWYVLIPASIVTRLTANFCTNWICHTRGYQNYKVGKDTSTNNVICGIITGGEGWHNNHHANPNNWRFGEKKWELDPTAFIIKNFLMKHEST